MMRLMAKKTDRTWPYALVVAACVALALLMAQGNAARAQLVCAQELYLDPAAGTDSATCGTADEPCATLLGVTEQALSCSAELDAPVNVVQVTGFDGVVTVGQANASGLADAPAAVDIGDTTETEADAAEEPAAEAVTAAETTDEAADTAVTEAAVAEAVAVEEDTAQPRQAVSRTRALYAVIALLLGVILGVVIGYGSRSGEAGAPAAIAVALLCATGATLTPTVVHAQQCPGEYAFFAPETGTDSETCGSAAEPCQTLQQTLSQAEACMQGVTIYQDGTPIFTLELSASLANVGEETISEIGGSAPNVEVADELESEGEIEEAAEAVVAESIEAVTETVESAEEAIGEVTAEVAEEPVADPVGDVDDWITWIGWLAIGAVLGYIAHALPAAKLE